MPDLQQQAAGFAQTIQRLLNGTVCDGVTIQAYVYQPTRVLVGHGLSKQTLEARPFRLSLGRGRPHGWLDVSYRLSLDDEGEYLTVVSSYVGIYASEDPESMLCHVDYERNKHRYPEAHLQVGGQSAALAAWRLTDGTKDRPLHDLHFPVGGRRYRPALEDVIEFLIAEKLARPRPGWEKVLDVSRGDFRRRQLRAAMRLTCRPRGRRWRNSAADRRTTVILGNLAWAVSQGCHGQGSSEMRRRYSATETASFHSGAAHLGHSVSSEEPRNARHCSASSALLVVALIAPGVVPSNRREHARHRSRWKRRHLEPRRSQVTFMPAPVSPATLSGHE